MGEARAADGQAPAKGVAAWRARAASPVTATVLGVLTLVLLAVAVALSGLEHQLSILGTGPIVPVVVAYIGVGVVVARRQPRNPIGWILLAFILLFVFSAVAGLYAVLSYRLGYHGLPLAPVAVLLQPLWAPALLLFPVVILLFPDGRLASRRWRWVLWAYAVLGACVCAAVFGPAVAAVAGHHVHLDSSGDATDKGRAPGGLAAVVWVVGLLAIVVIVLSFVAHQVLSWRRATGERRQQLKWLASGAAVSVAAISVNVAGPALDPNAPRAVQAIGVVIARSSPRFRWGSASGS